MARSVKFDRTQFETCGFVVTEFADHIALTLEGRADLLIVRKALSGEFEAATTQGPND